MKFNLKKYAKCKRKIVYLYMFAGEEGGQAVIEWDVLGVGFSPVRGLGVSASTGAEATIRPYQELKKA